MGAREFFKLAFCDNGQPSSSRLLTAATTVSSIIALLYATFHNHIVPDGTTLMGLGAYASSPYAVNRASKMFGSDKDSDTKTTVVVKQNNP